MQSGQCHSIEVTLHQLHLTVVVLKACMNYYSGSMCLWMHITSSISFSVHTCMCVYILSCLTWTRTAGAHWWSRILYFGYRTSAIAGLFRGMSGSQSVCLQAVKESLLLQSMCHVLLLFLASFCFSLGFHPLCKPQMPNDMPTDTTFPSAAARTASGLFIFCLFPSSPSLRSLLCLGHNFKIIFAMGMFCQSRIFIRQNKSRI